MEYQTRKVSRLCAGEYTVGLKADSGPRGVGMKAAIKLLLFSLLAAALLGQRPWQQVSVPSLRDVAANFKSPPHEYGAIQPFASWNGADPQEVRARIVRDFDRLAANGIFLVNLSPGRGEPKYLSPEHMDQVKFTVQEAAKRGMLLWIQDESDYPSGFAGGNISRQYPQLGMQGIVADIRVHVVPGQTLTMPAPSGTLAIFATKTSQDQQIEGVIPIPVPPNGELKWTVPAQGSTPNEPRLSWEVVFVRHVYLSSPTRNFNREDGTRAKDALYSLIDYLDPEATRAFLKITHETYRQAVGDQFGKIVLGFFGDEPDYSSSIPWTPRLLDEFQARKGYDLMPYIPSFFVGRGMEPSEETRRARADYYDVWSAIFQNSFFGEQAEWCRKYNVEYLVHLNHEETMIALERSEVDYFRDNRQVQVPGIDNLSQLVPAAIHTPDGAWNVNNNFPKLASSAAHLFGKPKVWAEEGGGVEIDGKFEMDFQLVRGVNALEIRVPVLRGGGDPSVAAPPPVIPPQAPMLAWYANRAGYVMAMGRPAAQVGLYHPGNSILDGRPGGRPQHHQTRLAVARKSGGLGLLRRAVPQSSGHYRERRFTEPQRPALQGGRVPVHVCHHPHRTGAFEGLRQSGRQSDFRRQDAGADRRQDVHERQGRARPQLRHAARALGRHHTASARGPTQAGRQTGRRFPQAYLHAQELAGR